MRTYYTLLSYEHGRWCPQFGDYDRKVVQEERDTYEGRTKIIRTDESQQAIDEAVQKLNGDRHGR